MLHLIAYDVVSNARRRRLAKLMEAYGLRVQDSVFESQLGPAEAKELLWRAEKLIERTDSLRCYPICAACAAKAQPAVEAEAADLRELVIL